MPSVSYAAQASTWQERLEGKNHQPCQKKTLEADLDATADACREASIMPPVFQIVSDRRGGRTAWSSRVTVHGRTLSARFWYDGKNLNNAKEDAAEMALNFLSSSAPSSPSNSRSSW